MSSAPTPARKSRRAASMIAPLRCGTSNPLTKPDADELRIVHVPLSAPLGDRELVLPDPPARD